MVISPERSKKLLSQETFTVKDGDEVDDNKSEQVSTPVKVQNDEVDEALTTRSEHRINNFGLYEFLLLILTQCGYLPVAASLLSTTFFEPSKHFCHHHSDPTNRNRGENLSVINDFHSLVFEYEPEPVEACRRAATLNFWLTFVVMTGGVVGSFSAGFLADRFGRKPVVVGTLLLLAASNLALLALATQGFYISLMIFFCKGFACGGYMVTNVVFILEAVKAQRTRLLVASLNGWPFGMVFTGLIGWLSTDWRWYSASIVVTANIFALLLYSRSFESVGWLDNRHKLAKANKIRQRILAQNQRLQVVKSLSFRSFDSSWTGNRSDAENAKQTDVRRRLLETSLSKNKTESTENGKSRKNDLDLKFLETTTNGHADAQKSLGNSKLGTRADASSDCPPSVKSPKTSLATSQTDSCVSPSSRPSTITFSSSQSSARLPPVPEASLTQQRIVNHPDSVTKFTMDVPSSAAQFLPSASLVKNSKPLQSPTKLQKVADVFPLAPAVRTADTDNRRSTISGLLKTQTYIDLFRHEEICRPLCALLFSFMTSSIVSFGFYFNADSMSGSRYVNLAVMGGLKFGLGLLPFMLSFMINKKFILIGSVGIACLTCWLLAVLCTWVGALESVISTVLSVLITASMDPTWKVIHLYSVELFPTAVRNMARGVCNVTARLGSMAGPLIILIRSINPLVPYWLFAFLLTVQLFVLYAYMPIQDHKELPQEMPSSNKSSPGETVIYS